MELIGERHSNDLLRSPEEAMTSGPGFENVRCFDIAIAMAWDSDRRAGVRAVAPAYGQHK